MEYLTSKQLSEKWGIGQCRIIRLAREGRIDGAKQFGKSWMFPDNAVKPIDGRTKSAKEQAVPDGFRFPLFVNCAEDSYNPPLTEEEATLREAELAFYACDFVTARAKLEPLCESAESIYVKIGSLFLMCALSAAYDKNINWNQYRRDYVTLLLGDFPHKPEMELLNPLLDCLLVQIKNASSDFTYEIGYGYHPSVHRLQEYLSFYRFIPNDISDYKSEHHDTYEILVDGMERDGSYAEAQCLHRIMFVSYMLTENTDRAVYHLRKMLSIAYEHNFIFPAADYEPYYADIYASVLDEYPKEFADRLHKYGKEIFENFTAFTAKYFETKPYSELTKKEYRIILYASQGYSNKQLAKTIGLSERTVANLLAGIYEKLGVKNKQELTELVNNVL